jgi:NAD(P)-dependent dehydrogenase (short-subunit alcohol dehydrogenase family)
VPIPGTRRLERLEENIGAVDVELTSDDLREIEDAASKIVVQGARLPEQLAASLMGPMNVTRAVLPVMRKQRSGHM